jgi:Zn-dependent peptidase ImmA (M78 family)
MNNLVIKKKANEFRSQCGLGSNDPIRVRSLLTKLNVITVFKPLGANFGGMSIKVNKDPDIKRFILVNSSRTMGNQHFTIAHECYHLFVQQNFDYSISPTGLFEKKTGEEYNADLFASYFLLPESGIQSLVPDEELSKNKITLKTILKTEQYFACSRLALLYRLKELDIIDQSHLNNFSINIKRGAMEHGFSTDLYEPGNNNLVLGDYGSVARELFDRQEISESHYFSLLLDLGMNIDSIEELQDDKNA